MCHCTSGRFSTKPINLRLRLAAGMWVCQWINIDFGLKPELACTSQFLNSLIFSRPQNVSKRIIMFGLWKWLHMYAKSGYYRKMGIMEYYLPSDERTEVRIFHFGQHVVDDTRYSSEWLWVDYYDWLHSKNKCSEFEHINCNRFWTLWTRFTSSVQNTCSNTDVGVQYKNICVQQHGIFHVFVFGILVFRTAQ